MAYSAIPIVGGGAAGFDGRRILNTWTVPSGHGLVAGDIVLYTGGVTGFTKAIANDISTSQVAGVVESSTVGTIRVVYQGEIDFEGVVFTIDDGATSLTAGTVYYLSPTNSGRFTNIRPSDGSSTIQGIMVATNTDTGIVINSLPNGGAGNAARILQFCAN